MEILYSQFEEKGILNRVENMVKMASVSDEPMKLCFSYDQMERMLEKSCLLICEHLSPEKLVRCHLTIEKIPSS